MREFVQNQDDDTRIGLVAVLRVRPARGGADDRARRPLLHGHRRADHRPGHDDRRRDPQVGRRDRRDRPGRGARRIPARAPTRPPRRGPGRPAAYAPEIVVLLTDGANTRGVEPVDAAKTAAERGVRVYPIGFGTRNPTPMVCTAAQLGGRGFEGYGGATRRCRRWLRRGQRPQLPRRRRGHPARGGRRHRRRVLRGRRRRAGCSACWRDLPRTVARPSSATSR